MLAFWNAARNPMRSTLSVGLMASASFLIVALGAFRQDATLTGAGGFEYIAESSEPIFANLGSAEGQKEIAQGRAAELAGIEAFGFRVKTGDDASCNNLYRSQKPRVLGVTSAFIAREKEKGDGFAWAAAEKREGVKTPWELLDASPAEGAIPVIVDMNTAMYGLGKFGGVGEEFSYSYDDAGAVRFRVVGLLSNSVLQGSLLIGEENFKKAFPTVAGYRYFLMTTPSGKSEAVLSLLEDRLSDQGFDATPSRQVLESLLAVQNTYLSTFQSLGALGLLLGTFGLAAVQIRNVLERRGELGLLQATGFTKGKIARLILLESATLLMLGLGVGAVSALAAVLPHLLLGGAQFPLLSLLGTLGLVLVAGLLATLIAVRQSMRTPVLAALRGS
jgi:putative ABC transport system permease protein